MTIVDSALQSQRVKETISGLHGDDVAIYLLVALICGRKTGDMEVPMKWRNSIFLLKQCCP
jgi:hypothetical protein